MATKRGDLRVDAARYEVERWRTANFGDVASLRYGKSLSAGERKGGVVPVLGSNGVIGYHDESLVSGPGIVVGRKGSAGAVTWIGSDFWPIDTTYYVDRRGEVSMRWLYYAMSMLRLEKLSEGPVPGLNRRSVAKLPLRLPPLYEQRKIATILSSVDNAIEKARRMSDQTQVVKRGLMQRLLTPQKGWRSVRLGEVADQRTTKHLPTLNNTLPYVALEHLAQGTPTVLGMAQANVASSAKTVFEQGDILFGKLRPNLRKAALAPFDGVCSTDIIPIYSGNDLDERFLVQLVHWQPFRHHATATSSGTKMPRTSWKQLKRFAFRLPPLHEQGKIGAVLSSVDAVVKGCAAYIDRLMVAKRSLMAVLLAGELRVTPHLHGEE